MSIERLIVLITLDVMAVEEFVSNALEESCFMTQRRMFYVFVRCVFSRAFDVDTDCDYPEQQVAESCRQPQAMCVKRWVYI